MFPHRCFHRHALALPCPSPACLYQDTCYTDYTKQVETNSFLQKGRTSCIDTTACIHTQTRKRLLHCLVLAVLCSPFLDNAQHRPQQKTEIASCYQYKSQYKSRPHMQTKQAKDSEDITTSATIQCTQYTLSQTAINRTTVGKAFLVALWMCQNTPMRLTIHSLACVVPAIRFARSSITYLIHLNLETCHLSRTTMPSPHQLHTKATSPSNGFVTHSFPGSDDHLVTVPGKQPIGQTLLQRNCVLHTFKPFVNMHIASL